MKAAAIGAGVAAAFVAAGKAAYEFGKAAVESAVTYQKQMSNVATMLTGDVEGRLAELSDGLLDISDRIGVNTEDLSAGLYDVISAYGDSADILETIETTAKGAKAANTSTTESLKLLSAITKGYGDTSAEAQQKAADLAFETLRLGQTSYPEMANSIGKVIPIASALSIEQEEVFGAYAALTGVTGDTARVSTQLESILSGLLTPTTQMTKALNELGYSDGLAMLSDSGGLQQSLVKLKDLMDGNEIAFANLFSNKTAKPAILALTGAVEEDFINKTAAMYEAAGAADRAFEAQTNNLADKLARIQNMGENFMTRAGMVLLPHIEQLFTDMMPVMEGFLEDMSGIFEELGPVIGEVFAEMSPVISSLVTDLLPPLADLFRNLLPPLMQIVKAILPPLTRIIGRLAPVLADIANAVLPVIAEVLEALMPVLSPILDVLVEIMDSALTPLLTQLADITGQIMDFIMPAIEALGEAFGTYIGDVVESIMPIVDNFLERIQLIISFWENVFSGNWEEAGQNLKDMYENVFTGLVDLVKAPFDLIQSKIEYIGNFFKNLELPDSLNNLFGGEVIKDGKVSLEGINDAISTYFTDTLPKSFDLMEKVVDKFFNETLPDKFEETFDALGRYFTEIQPYITGVITAKLQEFFTVTIPAKFSELFEQAKTVVTEIVPFTTGLITAKIRTFFTQTLPQKMSEFINGVVEFFVNLPEWAASLGESKIVPFFTETLPNKVSEFFASVATFITTTIPTWAASINSVISEFFTVTIPNAVQSIFSSFSAGFAAGGGGGSSGAGGGGRGAKGYATGGFTSGMSIAGEDPRFPVEAVLSFNPAYREQNLGYWAQAGRMLGALPDDSVSLSGGGGHTTVYAVDVNPDYGDVLIFEGGELVKIPVVTETTSPESLPPWRRKT